MNKQWIVAYKEANERNAEPIMFTCSDKEHDAIEDLLTTVCNEGDGPITTVGDGFVFEATPITLKEVGKEFADELAGAEAKAKEEEEEE